MRHAFARHSQRYGTRRLRAEVQAEGHCMGRWRIRRVLKVHGQRPAAALVRAPHHRFGPGRAGRPQPFVGPTGPHRPQPFVGPTGPHRPQPGLGGRHHVLAPPRRRLALPSRVARPLLA
ncbi:transposase [Hymenobacter perfusus]|uniref:Transposase n=1 Tax=Hymenobacter perfusus TaxID=1236770 RepID=A0A428JWB9_9BACT|nr:transposase [Hymenobacter perfusus]